MDIFGFFNFCIGATRIFYKAVATSLPREKVKKICLYTLLFKTFKTILVHFLPLLKTPVGWQIPELTHIRT
jgi:hypothetical protein